MIPYGATSDDPEPIFPWVNIGLIVTCFLAFFYKAWAPKGAAF